jgi:UDP-N-acetylglucosamine pyrophosphorylase
MKEMKEQVEARGKKTKEEYYWRRGAVPSSSSPSKLKLESISALNEEKCLCEYDEASSWLQNREEDKKLAILEGGQRTRHAVLDFRH